jgi:Ricin-type beta-trefoil lectin domain-like
MTEPSKSVPRPPVSVSVFVLSLLLASCSSENSGNAKEVTSSAAPQAVSVIATPQIPAPVLETPITTPPLVTPPQLPTPSSEIPLVTAPQFTANSGLYRLVNRHSQLCLGIQDASMLDYAKITQNQCNFEQSSLWKISPVSSDPKDAGFYSIVVQHAGKGLSITQAGTAQARAVQLPYLASPEQQWSIQPTADSKYARLINRSSGLPLSLPACSKSLSDQAIESQQNQDGLCTEFSQEFGFAVGPQPAPITAAYQQKDFVIGTYINPAMTTYTGNPLFFLPGDANEDRRRLADLKAAGFNLMVKSYRLTLPKEQTLRELALAAELNLSYIINDGRVDVRAQQNDPIDQSVAKSLTNDYINLPANLRNSIHGYDIGDELPVAYKSFKEWVRHVKTNDPTKLAHINLLPSYGLPSYQAYVDYVDAFYPLGADRIEVPDVISYDYYPLYKKFAKNTYFENMRVVSARAKALNISFWAYPISVENDATYRIIDPAYLRFVTFAPLAYGANGLIYYTYDTFEYCADVTTTVSCKTSSDGSLVKSLGEALIGFDHKTKTPIYYWTQEINRYVRDVVGPVIMRSQHLGVYHNSDYVYEGYGLSEVIPLEERAGGNMPVVAGFSDIKSNSMVSVLRDKADPQTHYLLVVNRAYSGAPLDVTLNLRGDLSGRVFDTSMVRHQLQAMPSQIVDSNTRVVVKSLLPGEGRLIKIAKSVTP